MILKWMLPNDSLFHLFKEYFDSFIYLRQKAAESWNGLLLAILMTSWLEGIRVHMASNLKGLG